MGIANPIAQILSAALLLDNLGFEDAARTVEEAVEADLAQRSTQRSGERRTAEVGDAIASRV